MQRVIAAADTFFIGTGHAAGDELLRANLPSQHATDSAGMDASHRGGAPSFVQMTSATTLVFPDYAGNNHYNTIGNLLEDDHAGLLFVDFVSGSMLQLTGNATVDWDSSDLQRFAGARRLVHFTLEHAIWLPNALDLRFDGDASAIRSLRVLERSDEADGMTSFVLGARDGGVLPRFAPGQHLPLDIDVSTDAGIQRLARTYSLSGQASPLEHEQSSYRITVKQHERGVVSSLLHTQFTAGAMLNASVPSGDFVLRESARIPVLIAAGIGVTPFVSMVHAYADSAKPIWLFHGVRDTHLQPFAAELRQLQQRNAGIELRTFVSSAQPQAVPTMPGLHVGRMDAAAIAVALPSLNCDFYVCGPPGFIVAISAGLSALGVAPQHISSEQF